MILVNKNRGELLSELLVRVREEHQLGPEIKITYAGRLDPMAEGLVLLLVNEDVHNKDQLLGLDKIYEFTVLLGCQTDTGDILGVVQNYTSVPDELLGRGVEGWGSEIKVLEGQSEATYPMYSSRTVQGKPLWLWAREGGLPEGVDRPKVQQNIKSIECLGVREVSSLQVTRVFSAEVARVSGDFRQAQTIEAWEAVPDLRWLEIECSALVGSGTYIRSICEQIGELVDLPALASSIKRTAIGDFSLEDC